MQCQCCNGEGEIFEDEYIGHSFYFPCNYCNSTGEINIIKWLIWRYNMWTIEWYWFKLKSIFINKKTEDEQAINNVTLNCIHLAGDYMARQKITKEWIDKLADYRDSKWIHQNGSILMLRKDVHVPPEVMEYAKTRRCEIRFETKEPLMPRCGLLPCPFCEGEANDLGYGILCRQCGAWVGNNWNSWIVETGLSYKQRWNLRPYTKEAKALLLNKHKDNLK